MPRRKSDQPLTVRYGVESKLWGFCCCRGCAISCECSLCAVYRSNPENAAVVEETVVQEDIFKQLLRERFINIKEASEKIMFLWRLLLSYKHRITPADKLKIDFQLGQSNILVCQKYWLQTTGITRHRVLCLSIDIKRNRAVPQAIELRPPTDRRIPSDRTFMAKEWMKTHFDLCADMPPNASEGTRHLSCTTKQEVYAIYRFENPVNCYISRSVFFDLWKQHFSHVTIRKFKQVGGKCSTCAKLSRLRCLADNKQQHAEVTEWSRLHKESYMRERNSYYTRRMQARSDPYNVSSIISDGMAQNHTKLPYSANRNESAKTLDLHLMGVIDHRINSFYAFLTYGNVINDTNLQLYVMLYVWEDLQKSDLGLPKTLYYQIDGAGTNSNPVTLALLHLFVARGLAEEVIVTRLPVGHTHEDIDARFGKLWEYFRLIHVDTPDDFKRGIQDAFTPNTNRYEEAKTLIQGRLELAGNLVKIVEVFAVPDYRKYFDDLKLQFGIEITAQRAFKEQWTQLQWKFKKTDTSLDCPTGVKVFYRSYAQEGTKYIELRDVHGIPWKIGSKPQRFTELEPVEVEALDLPSIGTSVLTAIPCSGCLKLDTAPFNPKYETTLNECYSYIKKTYATATEKHIVDTWTNFFESHFPKGSTNNFAYHATTQTFLHIPFAKELFGYDSPKPINWSYSTVPANHSALTLNRTETESDMLLLGNNYLQGCCQVINTKDDHDRVELHHVGDDRITGPRMADSRKTHRQPIMFNIGDRVRAPWKGNDDEESKYKGTITGFSRALNPTLSEDHVAVMFDDGDMDLCMHISNLRLLRGVEAKFDKPSKKKAKTDVVVISRIHPSSSHNMGDSASSDEGMVTTFPSTCRISKEAFKEKSKMELSESRVLKRCSLEGKKRKRGSTENG